MKYLKPFTVIPWFIFYALEFISQAFAELFGNIKESFDEWGSN